MHLRSSFFGRLATCVIAITLSGAASAQSYTSGTATAVVTDVTIPDSTQQYNSYNLFGESNLVTPNSVNSAVVNYGANANAAASGHTGYLQASAYAFQPLNGFVNYAEGRGQATIDDFAIVTGPLPVGTPVTETITMLVSGAYPVPDPDLSGNFALAGDSLSYTAGALNGMTSQSNAAAALTPLSLTFNTTIGAQVELNYYLDAWTYVNGVNPLGTTQSVSLTAGIYASSSLSGVTLVSEDGYIYATPTPSSLAALSIGLLGLLIRRKRTTRKV